jgi:ribose transport system ATP-binding protein
MILKVENVTKRFPGVIALDNVSFEVKTGEIHGIVGENGAGKSTMIKAIMGVHQINEGTITIFHNNEWIHSKNALNAKELGMYANYQNVNIASTLSVGENYFLGHLPCNKVGLVNWKKIYADSEDILHRFHMDNVDPRKKIETLPIALKEMITISKISMMGDVNLLIFDEPTAFFENDRVEELFRYILDLKAQGISIIYISHRLEEVVRICDRITILKDGKFVATKKTSEVNKDTLISLMVGRTIDDIYNIQHQKPLKEIMRVEGLTTKGKFEDISFSISGGEILGFFGLVGSGRSEVMKAVYGAEKIDHGKIFLHDKQCSLKNPIAAMKAGIGLVPEDRTTEGVSLGQSAKININLNSYDMISKFGFINIRNEAARANRFINALKIKVSSPSQLLKNLSGGNQQKIVISKLLCRNLDVFIFDEPTTGVDVGAKQEIYHLVEQLAKDGKAIILISSYLPEIMGLSDRLMVMSEGKIVGEINRDDPLLWNEEEILKIASNQISKVTT